MLNRGAYALALHPLVIDDRDTRGEKGIFAEILEVAAIHRRAINVHAGPQHEVHAPGWSVMRLRMESTRCSIWVVDCVAEVCAAIGATASRKPKRERRTAE